MLRHHEIESVCGRKYCFLRAVSIIRLSSRMIEGPQNLSRPFGHAPVLWWSSAKKSQRVPTLEYVTEELLAPAGNQLGQEQDQGGKSLVDTKAIGKPGKLGGSLKEASKAWRQWSYRWLADV